MVQCAHCGLPLTHIDEACPHCLPGMAERPDPLAPQTPPRDMNEEHPPDAELRDFFAAHVQADDRLVKCIRAMDDHALDIFARCPNAEREERITEVEFTNYDALPSEVAKVTRRLEIEAKAIARVRYMQADAMLAARATAPAKEGPDVADVEAVFPQGNVGTAPGKEEPSEADKYGCEAAAFVFVLRNAVLPDRELKVAADVLAVRDAVLARLAAPAPNAKLQKLLADGRETDAALGGEAGE